MKARRKVLSSILELKVSFVAYMALGLFALAALGGALAIFRGSARTYLAALGNLGTKDVQASPVKGYRVMVDGMVLGYVVEERDAFSVLEAWKKAVAHAHGYPADELRTNNEIIVEEAALTGGEPLLSCEDLMEAFKASISWLVRAHVIDVEGRDVVAVKTRQEAEDILSEIRSECLSSAAKQNTQNPVQVVRVSIKERINITEKEVPIEMTRSISQAKQVLLRGTDKLVTHTVQRGQSLWAIARAHNLTVDDLRRANPELKSDNLAIGQKFSISVAEPYVHVQSVEIVTSRESIPYQTKVVLDENLWPWQERVTEKGSPGLREMVYEVKRENNVIVEKNLIESKILKEPVTQVILRGSKLVPPKGTGEFAWPVQGSISSGYGWRWNRFHHGVDIVAPAGTVVHCADDGVVVFSGWQGSYGQTVIVDHGQGKLVTVYAHLRTREVTVGQELKKGDVLGTVGSTGRATGPHLHFEIRANGNFTNPLNYYK